MTVAIKIIDLEEAEDDIDDVQKEVLILSQVYACDFVTKYYGSFMCGSNLWIGIIDLLLKQLDSCLQ